MGQNASKRGSYDLSKLEKKDKKRSKKLTREDRTSSYIGLTAEQIYQDQIGVASPEPTTKFEGHTIDEIQRKVSVPSVIENEETRNFGDEKIHRSISLISDLKVTKNEDEGRSWSAPYFEESSAYPEVFERSSDGASFKTGEQDDPIPYIDANSEPEFQKSVGVESRFEDNSRIYENVGKQANVTASEDERRKWDEEQSYYVDVIEHSNGKSDWKEELNNGFWSNDQDETYKSLDNEEQLETAITRGVSVWKDAEEQLERADPPIQTITETKVASENVHEIPNDLKLENESSHVITADSIEKLRDLLQKQEQAKLLQIDEGDEEEEQREIVETTTNNRRVRKVTFESDEEQMEIMPSKDSHGNEEQAEAFTQRPLFKTFSTNSDLYYEPARDEFTSSSSNSSSRNEEQEELFYDAEDETQLEFAQDGAKVQIFVGGNPVHLREERMDSLLHRLSPIDNRNSLDEAQEEYRSRSSSSSEGQVQAMELNENASESKLIAVDTFLSVDGAVESENRKLEEEQLELSLEKNKVDPSVQILTEAVELSTPIISMEDEWINMSESSTKPITNESEAHKNEIPSDQDTESIELFLKPPQPSSSYLMPEESYDYIDSKTPLPTDASTVKEGTNWGQLIDLSDEGVEIQPSRTVPDSSNFTASQATDELKTSNAIAKLQPLDLTVPDEPTDFRMDRYENKNHEKAFQKPSDVLTPEEIAEEQMRMWDIQESTEIETTKSEIINITLDIKDVKVKIEELLPSEIDQESYADLCQTLIKIMREVNAISSCDFNQGIIDLKNAALTEINTCLKEIELKRPS